MDTIKYIASYKLELYSYYRLSFYNIFPGSNVAFTISLKITGILFELLFGLYPCKNKDIFLGSVFPKMVHVVVQCEFHLKERNVINKLSNILF